ncbi:hypothetical protein P3T27_007850 [Kitasatospora sp. MAA19]|uniref:hypothetical protein n=1 Tax=Kitasatospora sp. MAA19 TaxID=3035090 RepID=UPI002474D9E0|nr:hypothetical protein [Kitasatospora sp. MAA19]MDH6711098.1 hypothetical protein [Kitasatospora sp. MAA19]
MYVRKTQRRNKDGSVVRYVQLATNRRVGGTTQADVLLNLGREDKLDLDSLRRLVASLNRYLGDTDVDVAELLAVERAAADRARRALETAERERRRPACRRCSAPFSDERWEEKERGWNDDGLCAGCRQADADQKAREEAERERAAVEAAEAEAKRSRPWWRRT